MVDETPPRREELPNDWQLYELLLRTLEHYHTRWVDNYRIFLSFNALLLPAVTALFGYATKTNEHLLRVTVLLLCVVGLLVTAVALGLLERIAIDTKLRLTQVRRLENVLTGMSLKPFQEAWDFFFSEKDIGDLKQRTYRWKGIRALNAYRLSSAAVIIYYALLGLLSIFPNLLPIGGG
jgi:hypothetical protein